jgi:hypothetical protein
MIDIHKIDIESTITLLKDLPMKYTSPSIKIARGKWKLATNWKKMIKKVKNG